MPLKHVSYSIEFLAEKLAAVVQHPKERAGQNADGTPTLITRIASLEESAPEALSFCRKLPREIPNCGALLCDAAVAQQLSNSVSCLVVPDPLRALVEIIPFFFEPDPAAPGVHPSAIVDPTARIAASASIGALCVIGAGVTIGENTILHPHVCVYPRVRIGRDVLIHARVVLREDIEISAGVILQPGAVIGADGFGYIADPKRGLVTVPQIGTVILDAAVEVGANSCIDRATLGRTLIGQGTKLDNLVQVAHNVRVGSYSLLCAQVGIAGSCTIGNNVVLGGHSGVGDHVKIVDNVRVAAKAGVIQDISKPGDYGGYPAVPAREWRRMVGALVRLPDRLRKLSAKSNDEE